jgi:hypothetical protein
MIYFAHVSLLFPPDYNSLRGTLPTELGQLTRLIQLELGKCFSDHFSLTINEILTIFHVWTFIGCNR